MKYICFDIECSNCYMGIGKICEFGYIIFDEKFNILTKDDIQINPGRGRNYRFTNRVSRSDPNFSWAYDIDSYFECEEFPFFYERIRNLICDKDTKVLGFSVENDMRYLSAALRRYGFSEFDYIAYDIQEIAKHYHGEDDKSLKLNALCEELCNSEDMVYLTHHLSRDDAICSMLVLKNICKNLNLSIEEILTKYDDIKIESILYLEDFYRKRKEKRNKEFANRRKKKMEEKLKSNCN